MDPKQVNEIVFKLAHFNPTYKDDYGNQVIDYLIMDALASFGTELFVSPTEVVQHIQSVFHVSFEETEIISASRRLHQRNLIKIDKPKSRGYPRLQITKK